MPWEQQIIIKDSSKYRERMHDELNFAEESLVHITIKMTFYSDVYYCPENSSKFVLYKISIALVQLTP